MSMYLQIRKYLLWIALLVLVVLGWHISALYWYHDAKSFPVQGGTLHVGLVGHNNSIDLLAYDPRSSGNETNDMIIHFLYRGILTYDLEQRKIVEDLGNCGIDQFPTFRCTLNANALWHDGSPIEIEDVVATYEFYTSSAKNPGFQSRLEKLSVYEDSGEVVFDFSTSDITTLNLLFLPILKKEDIGSFEEQYDFSQLSFSGPFVYEKRRVDEETGVDQLLFSRNPIYGDINDTYLSHLVLSFFSDLEALTQNKGRLHVSLLGESMSDSSHAGLAQYQYQRPQYYSAFLHSEELPIGIRESLVTTIFPNLEITEDSLSPMDTVFFDVLPYESEPGDESPVFLSEALVAAGYRLGSDASFLEVSEVSDEAEEEAPEPAPIPEATDGEGPLLLSSLTYLSTPTTKTPLFTTEEFLIFEGSFPDDTTEVSVNDYVLQSFDVTEGKFVYRARPEFGNLIEGKNTYRVKFTSEEGRVLDQETVVVYYATSEEDLEPFKESYKAPEVDVPVVVEEAPEEEVIEDTGLEDDLYYDTNRQPFTLRIAYIQSSAFLESYAQDLASQLLSHGVTATLLPLSGDDLSTLLTQGESQYDILLTGIHLGIFDYNILPFFHSGQAKSGQNFARVRNLELDGLLEQLRSGVYYSNPDRLRTLQQDILSVLDSQYVVYPIASPYEYAMFHEGVSGIIKPEFLPSSAYVPHALMHSALNHGFEAVSEGKGVGDFFKWILESIF